MADKVFIYWASGSPPCWRVMLALEEKGLSGYGNKLLRFDKNEHKGEEVLKWNPRGQLPTLVVDDSFAINESFAACDFFEAQYQSQGTRLIPENKRELATMLQRKYELINLDTKGREVIQYVFFKKGCVEGKLDTEKQKKLCTELYEELNNWDKYAAENEFIAGKNLTMADVILFPFLAILVRFGLDLKAKAPHLAAYYHRMTKRPSVEKTWPPHWKENPAPATIFI